MRWLPLKLTGAAALAALTPLIAACSDVNVNLPKGDLLRPNALSFSGQKEEFTLPPPGPEELVGPQGQCAVAAPGTGATGEIQGGIALQMTECDVVRRAGSPEGIEFGPDGRGARSVVLTYIRGPRPGIYRFAAGRLVSIERAPEPPGPARQPKSMQTKSRS